MAYYRAPFAPAIGFLNGQVQRYWWHNGQTVEIKTAGDLQRLGVSHLPTWQENSDDPQLILDRETIGATLPKGWYLLTAQFEAEEGTFSNPCLYPDYGELLSARTPSVRIAGRG